MRTVILSLVALAWWSGCDDAGDRPATWSYIHAAIIVPSCVTASCHSSLTVRAGIVLEDRQDAYDLLLAEQLIAPGDLNSGLLFLLRGDERTLMPPDAPLPAVDVDLVEEWIVLGANPE